MADGFGSIGVEEIVVMPSDQVWVEEDVGVGEVVVVIDDMGEIDHGLVAFVQGVFSNNVYGGVHAGKLSIDPGDVFVG